jgi:hypothetical protein
VLRCMLAILCIEIVLICGLPPVFEVRTPLLWVGW